MTNSPKERWCHCERNTMSLRAQRSNLAVGTQTLLIRRDCFATLAMTAWVERNFSKFNIVELNFLLMCYPPLIPPRRLTGIGIVHISWISALKGQGNTAWGLIPRKERMTSFSLGLKPQALVPYGFAVSNTSPCQLPGGE
jgi:hypothetical protein